jgi:ABC-2 type transport system permease protein
VSRVLLVARTELLRRVRSRAAIVTAFLAPLALGVVFGVLIGGANNLRFRLGVVDADRSELSRSFVDGLLRANGHRPPGARRDNPIRFRTVATAGAARHQVDDAKIDAALVIPAGFGAATQASHPTTLLVLRRPQQPVSGQVAQAVADGLASGVQRVNLSVVTVSSLQGRAPSESLVAAARSLDAPLATADLAMGARQVSPLAFYGAAMAMVFLFFTVSFAARSLLAERHDGTLGRILATPTSAGTVVAGKVLGVCALAVAGFVTVWIATSVLFGADWGDPVPVVVLILATVAALGGVSTFVCSLARTEQQADSYASAVTFVLALLGGNFIGPGQAPDVLRRVALFTPNGWALRAFTDVSADAAGLGRIAGAVLVLLAFAVGFGAVGLWRVRRGIEQ